MGRHKQDRMDEKREDESVEKEGERKGRSGKTRNGGDQAKMRRVRYKMGEEESGVRRGMKIGRQDRKRAVTHLQEHSGPLW